MKEVAEKKGGDPRETFVERKRDNRWNSGRMGKGQGKLNIANCKMKNR